MKKKASDLVIYCIKQVGRPYWLSGYGQEGTKSLYNWIKETYSYRDTALAKSTWEGDYANHKGQKVHDCCGMIKGFCWTDSPDAMYKTGQYQTNGCGDWGVDTMYKKCSKKGDIKSIPEIPGLLVFDSKKTHVGIYIGNGEVVEARGHKYGVQRNKLKSRSFVEWGMLDVCIDYDTATTSTKKYAKEVEEYQRMLNRYYGFYFKKNENIGGLLTVDGSCGKQTKLASVIAMQDELNTMGANLEVDGICGSQTMLYMNKFTLQKGHFGDRVYIIQGLLYGRGYDPKGFDGSFGVYGGNGLLNAVKQFQKDNGLPVTGKVDGKTFYHLTL